MKEKRKEESSQNDLLLEAGKTFNEGEVDKAYHLFSKVIRKPNSPWSAWTGYILSGLDSMKTAELLSQLSQPMESGENFHNLAYALLLYFCGRIDAFGEALKKAKYPAGAEQVKLVLEARFLDEMGDTNRAEKISEKILQESPTCPFVLRSLDRIFEQSGNWENRRKIREVVERQRASVSTDSDVYWPIMIACARVGTAFDPGNKYSDERKRYEINLVARDFFKNVEVLEIAGGMLFELKEWELGQRIYDIVRSKADTINTRSAYANIASIRGNEEEFSRIQLEILKQFPEYVRSYLAVIDNMLSRKIPQEAMIFAEEGIAKCGRETALLVAMAKIAHAIENDQLAGNLLEEALSIGNLAGDRFVTAAGLSYSMQNLELCEKILQSRPSDEPQALIIAAVLALREGKEEEAIKELSTAYEKDEELEKHMPKEIIDPLVEKIRAQEGKGFPPSLIRHLGVSLAYNQHLHEGMNLVRLAIDLGDRTEEAYTHVIQMLLNKGELSAAISYAQQAARCQCLSRNVFVILLRFLLAQGDIMQVRSFIEELRQIPGLSENLLPSIAEFYARILEDSNEAITALEERCGPDSSVELFDNLAQWLADEKRYTMSAEVCKKALEKYPDHADFLGRLSFALEKSGLANESLYYCEECLKIDPTCQWPLNKMIRHYTAVFEPQKAREVFEKAIQTSPESRSIRSDYAKFLFQFYNDASAAAEQMGLALLADPGNGAIARKLHSYSISAEGIQQAFGPDALKWVIDNREKLQHFVSRLISVLGNRLLACACLPPEKSESAEQEEEEQKESTGETEEILPRLFILFSDIDEEETQLESEINVRNNIVKTELDKCELTNPTFANHWSGLWRECFDGKYSLFQALEVGHVLHDKRYLAGLRHLWRHRQKVLSKFEKYVAAYVIAGSFVRGDAREDSDIDVWVVIDDTDVKKMTRSELDAKLSSIIRGMAKEAADELEIKDRLHIQTYLLTDYWAALRDADPVITTFLSDGRPLYDRGIFTAWRILHNNGRIAPPREVISDRLRRANEAFGKMKGTLFSLAEQALYQPLLMAAQGVLLAYGEQPPTPIKTVEALKRLCIMSDVEINCLRDIINLIDSCKHGGLDEISVASLDRIANEMPRFLSAAEAAVEKVYAQVKGSDLSRIELIEQFKYWLGELCKLSNIALSEENTLSSEALETIGKRQLVDPKTLGLFTHLMELSNSDNTVTPDARTQIILGLARGQLTQLKQRIVILQRQKLRRDRTYFSYGDKGRGEIIRCDEQIYVIHDIADPSGTTISCISLEEEDYGSVFRSSVKEYYAAVQKQKALEDSRPSLILTETILRSIKVAVGEDPEIDMSL